MEISIGDYENSQDNVYFRRNVTKLVVKVEVLRSSLDRFLKRVNHTGDNDGTQADNGQSDHDSIESVPGSSKEEG
jgi:hypothetical protein